MNKASNGNSQQIQPITIYDRMLVRIQLQHAKAWVWYIWKTALFLAIKKSFITANMPELVQGGRLKIDCVRTRGFESHWMHSSNTFLLYAVT